MNVIRLGGCALEPLGKLFEGAGRASAGFGADRPGSPWMLGPRGFCLETELDEATLVDFFLTRYAPTPILSPWNGGSGFYPKDRKVGLEGIASSTSDRFSVYRQAIERAQAIRGVVTREGRLEGRGRRAPDGNSTCVPEPSTGWVCGVAGMQR